jgi:hypothetical protein
LDVAGSNLAHCDLEKWFEELLARMMIKMRNLPAHFACMHAFVRKILLPDWSTGIVSKTIPMMLGTESMGIDIMGVFVTPRLRHRILESSLWLAHAAGQTHRK